MTLASQSIDTANHVISGGTSFAVISVKEDFTYFNYVSPEISTDASSAFRPARPTEFIMTPKGRWNNLDPPEIT